MNEPVIAIEVRRSPKDRLSSIPDWEIRVVTTISTESAVDAAGSVLESLRDLVDG